MRAKKARYAESLAAIRPHGSHPLYSLVKMKFQIVFLLLAAVMLTGCVMPHPDPYGRHGRHRGAVVGAVAGGVIGHNVRGVSKWEGAAAGAVIGGVMGDAHAKANRGYYGHGHHHRHHRRPYYGYY